MRTSLTSDEIKEICNKVLSHQASNDAGLFKPDSKTPAAAITDLNELLLREEISLHDIISCFCENSKEDVICADFSQENLFSLILCDYGNKLYSYFTPKNDIRAARTELENLYKMYHIDRETFNKEFNAYIFDFSLGRNQNKHLTKDLESRADEYIAASPPK